MKTEVLQRELDVLKSDHTQALMAHDMRKASRILKDIDRKKAEIRIAKDEEIIQAAMDSGAISKISELLSAVQILNCEANGLVEETVDIFNDCGLRVDSIISKHRAFVKAADEYFKEFSRMIQDQDKAMAMFKDMDSFDRFFRMWAGFIPKEKPNTKGCKAASQKSLGNSKICKKCPMIFDFSSKMCMHCMETYKAAFEKGAKWGLAKDIKENKR